MALANSKHAVVASPEWSPEIEIDDDDRYVLMYKAEMSVNPEHIGLQIDGRNLTIKADRANPNSTIQDFVPVNIPGLDGIVRAGIGPPHQHFHRSFVLPPNVEPEKAIAYLDTHHILTIRIPKSVAAKWKSLFADPLVSFEPTDTASERRLRIIHKQRELAGEANIPSLESVLELFRDPLATPIPIDLVAPVVPSIEPPKTQTHERHLAKNENIIVANDGTLFKGGVPFQPLSLAASQAQVHRTTLLHWVKNETEVAGRPLLSYYFAPLATYFISEESIQRVANRFVKWPSQEPAGRVTLGETDDGSGYLSLSEAQEILGVSKRTMYLWATQKGKAPTEKVPDVIRCTGSNQFYISEKDVYDLKKLIPKRGLHRGPRPRRVPEFS